MFQAFAKEREMSNLKVGDKVYAKHKNTRYYKATVVKIERQIFCLLDFDDGSFSDDTFPEDIVVCFITACFPQLSILRYESIYNVYM